jgi:hypothetical protein
MISRESRKRRVIRLFFGLCAAIFAAYMAAASAGGSGWRKCADQRVPTNFDYLVLASMADSRHPLAMASYQTATGSSQCGL